MITVDCHAWKCFVLSSVDTRLESLWCDGIVNWLCVTPSGECQFVLLEILWGKSIHQGHFTLCLCANSRSLSSFIGFYYSKASYCSCPLFIGIRSNLSITVSLYNGGFSWELLSMALWSCSKNSSTRFSSRTDVDAYICTTVLFLGLVEMRIVMILLETGVQLMTDVILALFVSFTRKPSQCCCSQLTLVYCL